MQNSKHKKSLSLSISTCQHTYGCMCHTHQRLCTLHVFVSTYVHVIHMPSLFTVSLSDSLPRSLLLHINVDYSQQHSSCFWSSSELTLIRFSASNNLAFAASSFFFFFACTCKTGHTTAPSQLENNPTRNKVM